MSEGASSEDEISTIDVSPSGRIVETLARREAIPSVFEAIDNAIDAARRQNRTAKSEDEMITEAAIHVRYSDGEDEEDPYVEIEDTCGGVTKGGHQTVLRPGSSSRVASSTDIELPDAIGWAGVGAIRGAMSIGGEVTFFSRARGEDQGYKATVTKENYTSDDTQVPLEPVDIPEGTSIIRIEDLTIDPVEDFSKGDNESELEGVEHGDALIEEIASTYSLFLGEEFPGIEEIRAEVDDETNIEAELDLDITVNGTSVTDYVELTDYAWSFVQMDDLHPRAIANYRLKGDDIEGLEGELRVDFTVGLLQEKDSDRMGVTLYANRRKILDADTRKAVQRKFHFNKFNTVTQGRLCIVISVLSLESPEHIPTTDQKDTLNFDFNATKEMMKAVGRLGVEFQRHSKSKDLPVPITQAYPSGHPQASNDGEIEAHDYKKRENIIHKPGEPGKGRYNDFPEYPVVVNAIERDASLGIYCPSNLAPEYRPAYTGITEELVEQYPDLSTTMGYHEKEFREKHGDSEFFSDSPVEVQQSPPPEYDLEFRLKFLHELAKRHADSGRQCFYTGFPEYEVPFYKAQLVNFGAELEELENIDELPEEEQPDNLFEREDEEGEQGNENGSNQNQSSSAVLSDSLVEEYLNSSQRADLEETHLPDNRDSLSEATKSDVMEVIAELYIENQELHAAKQEVEEVREKFEEFQDEFEDRFSALP